MNKTSTHNAELTIHLCFNCLFQESNTEMETETNEKRTEVHEKHKKAISDTARFMLLVLRHTMELYAWRHGTNHLHPSSGSCKCAEMSTCLDAVDGWQKSTDGKRSIDAILKFPDMNFDVEARDAAVCIIQGCPLYNGTGRLF